VPLARAAAALAVVLFAAAAAPTGCVTGASRPARGASSDGAEDGLPSRMRVDVNGARELDREGVQSFREGRYGDAIRYFRTAYRLGGPSSELWNIARAREKVDDFEGADAALREYLERSDLSWQDRSEADREARALRARPSVLTVTTTPAGAAVLIDKRQTAGPTPVSVEVPPGAHSIAVHRDGYVVVTREVEARFGRAVIVSLDLVRPAK
jgi:hypothetical protein